MKIATTIYVNTQLAGYVSVSSHPSFSLSRMKIHLSAKIYRCTLTDVTRAAETNATRSRPLALQNALLWCTFVAMTGIMVAPVAESVAT